jgi:drug/metabolite transporter (DMT)-like permease
LATRCSVEYPSSHLWIPRLFIASELAGLPLARRAPVAESRAKVAAAFAAIYIIWGSTFLGIRYAIETMPPLLMAGTRFVIAGAILYVWAAIHEGARPTRRQWIDTAIVGALLLTVGNGAVSWAEQYVPSGLAALVVAITPLWMVVFESLRRRGDRPNKRILGGIALGFIGLVLLIGPGDIMGGAAVDPRSAAVLLAGTLAWAGGSIYSRSLRLPASARLSTAMQMLAAGVLLLVAGLIGGESSRVSIAAISLRSILAFGYLIIFGSIVGFTAYSWLLTVSSAARVSTYAYVNPVVALLLGWALANEPLTPRTILAAGVVLAGVALITLARAGHGRKAAAHAPARGARPADEPAPEESRTAAR